MPRGEEGQKSHGDTAGGLSPPPGKGHRLTKTNGQGGESLKGFTVSFSINETGFEATHLAGTSPLHDAYPFLYPALPGGRYREGRMNEARRPLHNRVIGKILAETLLASPAASTFPPPVLGVDFLFQESPSLK